MIFAGALLLVSLAASSGVCAQLTISVGPTTPLSKKTKVCKVLEYGAKADNKTNMTLALGAAFQEWQLPHDGGYCTLQWNELHLPAEWADHGVSTSNALTHCD